MEGDIHPFSWGLFWAFIGAWHLEWHLDCNDEKMKDVLGNEQVLRRVFVTMRLPEARM